MVVANAYLLQFASPDPSAVSIVEEAGQVTASVLDTQEEFARSSTLTQFTIYPAQHPMPRGGGLATGTVEFFSDSPTYQPALYDKFRYAYGRPNADTETYGNLRDSSGLFVTQREFEVTCGVLSTQLQLVGTVKEVQFGGTYSVINSTQGLLVSEDVDVEQFRFLLVALPVPYSSKNPIDSDVFLRAANPTTFPLSSGTVSLYLDGSQVSGLVVEPFFAGLGGLDITWNNVSNFDYGAQVDVRWVLEDTAVPANEIVIEYWFRTVEDRVGPRVVDESPPDDSEGVLRSTTIQFDVLDSEAGVDISSLVLHVNSVLVETSDPNLTILEIAGGYRVYYNPPTDFLYGDLIPVVVLVSDISANKNTTFFQWSFTTERSLAPLVLEMSPAPCSTGVQRIGNVSFEVLDAGGGLLKESITMGIESSTRDGVLLVPIVRRLV